MSERWVVNASPLILLAKVNHLDLPNQLSDSFVVPQARLFLEQVKEELPLSEQVYTCL
jgi:predicted nucleic acid-binding protein